MQFQIFRVKVHRRKQLELYTPVATPSEILRSAILSKPNLRLGRGKEWMIGNIDIIDQNSLSF